MSKDAKVVAVIMGSKSDLRVMKGALAVLESFGVPFVAEVVSAHRTAEHMVEFAKSAEGKGIKVIIAGAGGAAHLPGMVASLTPLPVIGVPVNSSNSIKGVDSLLSIVQMPSGVPVATVGVDNAQNAALLAVRMLGIEHQMYREEMKSFMENKKNKVLEDRNISNSEWKNV